MTRKQAWLATALWTWVFILTIIYEWSRTAQDQVGATILYILLWIFGLSFVWPFVDKDDEDA